MRVVVAADHAGFKGKAIVTGTLKRMGHDVVEIGAVDETPIDFPDVAAELARQILTGACERGIMVCGSGIGAAMAANRIPGIRAALAHDIYSAHQCVEHDNANVLCLGADIVGPKVMSELIETYMHAQWLPDDEFHARVAKLDRLAEAFEAKLPPQ